MRLSSLALLAVITGLAGCASSPRSGTTAPQMVRVSLPPDQAAACFARNAEEHSGALVAEVQPAGETAEVIVRVRNGVHYGAAKFTRSGTGSTARIQLNVVTNRSRGELIDSLLEGC